MSLADHIRQGHYGINAGEVSAPSSSIIWPLLLVPVSSLIYAPLLLNVFFAAATVVVYARAAELALQKQARMKVLASWVVVSLVLVTNLVGLVYTGMEHSLQVFLVSVVALGLMREAKSGQIGGGFLLAVVLAPLVRYECMAVSAPALSYLLWRGHYVKTLIAGTLIVVLVAGFSGFLLSLGLSPFPTSVVAKSSVVEHGGSVGSLLSNLQHTVLEKRQGAVLFLMALAFLASFMFPVSKSKRSLALVSVVALLLHLIAGRIGWYNRYEVYVLAFASLLLVYVYAHSVAVFLSRFSGRRRAMVLGVMCLLIFAAGKPYIRHLFTLPIASNNIYQQQYQMHRFAVEYFGKPVAVNDLGYVAFQNSSYVLDLWGLGSQKAFEYRNSADGGEWLAKVCEESDVGLVMIYESWFQDIPAGWVRLGALNLGRRRITPAERQVVFYATSESEAVIILARLQEFVATLPSGVTFVFGGEENLVEG